MPRTRFQESSQNISKHRELVGSGEFQRACDYGILEYVARLTSSTDAGDQAAMHAMGLKISGAHEFLLVIRMLSEKPTAPTPTVVPNLDHKA